MPRGPRVAPGGMIYHVLNRANARRTIFETDKDFEAFIKVVNESLLVVPTRILAYCVMSNHWHFVMWPEHDAQLSALLHQMTTTHVRRWHKYRNSNGEGHIYQGPFKSFPVQTDEHFYNVCRYVERNAVRANIVDRVEDWIWGSCWRGQHVGDPRSLPVAEWPLPRPDNWTDWVNQPLTESELCAVRTCARRGCPYGSQQWQRDTARRLGIEHTLRSPGRPRLRV